MPPRFITVHDWEGDINSFVDYKMSVTLNVYTNDTPSLNELITLLTKHADTHYIISVIGDNSEGYEKVAEALVRAPQFQVYILEFTRSFSARSPPFEKVMLAAAPTVRHIEFSANYSAADHATFAVLRHLPVLERLEFTGMPAIGGAAMELGMYLATNPSLREYFDYGNAWSDADLALIISGLKTNTNLKEFVTYNQHAGNKTAHALADVIPVCDLRGFGFFYSNNAEGEARARLVEVIKKTPRIEEFVGFGIDHYECRPLRDGTYFVRDHNIRF